MLDQTAKIAKRLLTLRSEHPGRVAVDGFCSAGKTTFAEHLTARLTDSGRTVIRATTDDFQNPPAIRWQDGEDSPQGFYLHAIDFESLRTQLLVPLGPDGNFRYRTSTFDIRKMKPNLSNLSVADPTSILIVDGLFLLTRRLCSFWDFSIFVETSFDTCIARARLRNQEQLQDANSVEMRYREKYVPGYKMYLDQDQPRTVADIVVYNDNNDQNGP